MAVASTAAFAGDADTSTSGDEQATTVEGTATTEQTAATMHEVGSGGREPTSQPGAAQRGDDGHDRWVASIWSSP